MNQDRLKMLFQGCDPTIRQVIVEVVELEQQHILSERPRIKDPLNDIVTRVTKAEMARQEKAQAEVTQ